jgi:hypothetical protein
LDLTTAAVSTTANGSITLTSSGTQSLGEAVTAGGTGGVTLDNGDTVSGAGLITAGTLTLEGAGDVGASGAGNAISTKLTTLTLSSPTGNIYISDTSGALKLNGTMGGTDPTLSVVETGGITVNSALSNNTGATSAIDLTGTTLTLTSSINGGTGGVTLDNSGAVSGAGTITAGTLTLEGAGAVGATGAGNAISTKLTTLTLNSPTGNIYVSDTGGGLDLNGTMGGTDRTLNMAESGGITVNSTLSNTTGATSAIDLTGTSLTLTGGIDGGTGGVTLDNSGAVTGAGTITAGTLTLQGAGAVGATGVGNAINTDLSTLTLNTPSASTGSVYVSDSGGALDLNGTMGGTDRTLNVAESGGITVNSTLTNNTGATSAIDLSAASLTLDNSINGGIGAVNVTNTGSVTVNNGTSIEVAGNGSIDISATGTITDNGTISAEPGTIMVGTTGDISMTGGTIESQTTGSGAAGAITVSSGGTLDLDSDSMIESKSEGSGIAVANPVMVTAGGELSLDGGSEILSTTSGGQTGANITVDANENTTSPALSIDGSQSGIFSTATATAGTGTGGSISVLAQDGISLTNGGSITASTSLNGQANAGSDVYVEDVTGDVTLGDDSHIETSSSDAPAGYVDVDVDTGNLTLQGGSSIESDMSQGSHDTATTGATGPVTVKVGQELSIASGVFIRTAASPNTKNNPNSYTMLVGQVAVTTGASSGDLVLNGTIYTADITGNYKESSANEGGLNLAKNNYILMENLEAGYAVNSDSVGVPTVATYSGTIGSGGTGTVTSPPPSYGIVLDDTLETSPDNLVPATQEIMPTPAPGTQGWVYTIDVTDGEVVGSQNLFLSFADFNLGQSSGQNGYVNETVEFNAPNIQNIVARITGGMSTIAGTIAEAATTTANIYLLNPSGIIFTGSAGLQLNANASLTLSSANYVALQNGGAFYGLLSQSQASDDLIKTGNTSFEGSVSQYGFTPNSIGPIEFEDVNDLSTTSPLQVIGGDITFDQGSEVTAGQVVLFSAASPGTLEITSDSSGPVLQPSGFTSLGAIEFEHESLLTSPQDTPAAIVIQGGSFELSDSQIIDETSSLNAGDTPGNVLIDVEGDATIISATSSSFISTSTLGNAPGGSVEIDAGSLTINGQASDATTGILTTAQPPNDYSIADGKFESYAYDMSPTTSPDGTATENGNAGSITLKLSGPLIVENNGSISAATYGAGDAGTIEIMGANGSYPAVTVESGGSIASSTSLNNAYFSQSVTGAGGPVTIDASALTVTGSASTISTAAGELGDLASGLTGTGGSISINIYGGGVNNTVSISDGGTISASSYTAGEGGTIQIGQIVNGVISNAPSSINIDGGPTQDTTTGLFAGENGSGSSEAYVNNLANQNNPNPSYTTEYAISVATGVLTVQNGGEISTQTGSAGGSAGDISITCSGSGNLAVPTSLDVTTTGQITSATSGSGQGGSITLAVTGDLAVTGLGEIIASGQSTGPSGEITITQSGSTDLVDPSTVGTAGGPATNGGLYLDDGTISTAADGEGSLDVNKGDITLNVQGLSVTDGSTISSDTEGQSNAGNISVYGSTGSTGDAGQPSSAQFVVVQAGPTVGSSITSDTDFAYDGQGLSGPGNGGTITINSGSLAVTGVWVYSTNGLNLGVLYTPIPSQIATQSGNVDNYNDGGNGGTIDINVKGQSGVFGATGDVKITNGGQISASSYSTGDAGTITITQSGSADLVDPSTVGTAGGPATNGGLYLDDGTISTAADGEGSQDGNKGDITLNVQGLTLTDLSQILSGTQGQSNAGDININGPGGTGTSTQFVVVRVGTYGGSFIASNTSFDYDGQGLSDAGNGGTITINSGSLTVTGTGINGPVVLPSQVSTQANANYGYTAGGNGGTININVTGQSGVVGATGDVKVTNGGQISASSSSSGDAGTITITQSDSADLVDPATVGAAGGPATNGGLYMDEGTISTGAYWEGSQDGNKGDITLNVQGLSVTDGSTISSGTQGQSNAGNINVYGPGGANTSTQFVVVQAGPTGGSVIESSTEFRFDGQGLSGLGNGGTITINSGSLTVTGGSEIATQSYEYYGDTDGGNGGTININVTGQSGGVGATGDVNITNGGTISASSQTTGDAGTITITQSGSTDLVDPATVGISGGPATNGGLFISAGTISTAAYGEGSLNGSATAGTITLNVQGLTVTAAGQITSNTEGQSNAGNIRIYGPGGSGTDTQFVVLQGGSAITSDTDFDYDFDDLSNPGNGGTITLNSGSLTVDGAGTLLATSTANANADNGLSDGGNGGTIDVTVASQTGAAGTTGDVAITNGGEISGSSASTGAAGAINVTASSSISVDGAGSTISTDFGPNAQASPTSGAGEITLNSQALTVENDATISADTASDQANGGTITAKVPGSVSLLNGGTLDASSTAPALAQGEQQQGDFGSGTGGSIYIGCTSSEDAVSAWQPQALDIFDGSSINCGSEYTDGGSIEICAYDVDIQHDSAVETSAAGNGGDITINAGGLFYLNDYSDISTHAGEIGGNITIDPEFVILNHSYIDAFGGTGDGNVIVDADFLLSGDSSITASGSVSIDSLPLDLTGSLISLPADLTDEELRLRESCARAINHAFSSLIVVGRGGIETAPDELNSDSGFDSAGVPAPYSAGPQEKLKLP